MWARSIWEFDLKGRVQKGQKTRVGGQKTVNSASGFSLDQMTWPPWALRALLTAWRAGTRIGSGTHFTVSIMDLNVGLWNWKPSGVLETFLISKHVRPSLCVQATHPAWWCTHVVKKLGMGAFWYENKIVFALQCSWSTAWQKRVWNQSAAGFATFTQRAHTKGHLWSYSSFHPCLFVLHTQRPQFPCLMRHCQSGSKVYNGICSKMLTGSGNKVLVRQKGLQS